MNIKKFEELEKKLQNVKLLVVGDCILDRYFFGEVNRISPEAPVPVFNLKKITYSLGGASNVSANLRGLGTEVELMGVVGKDDKGKILKKLAENLGIGTKGILETEDRPTIVKTRIIAQSQHLLRIDWEENKPLPEKVKQEFQKIYSEILKEVQGVILSDYAKGVFLSEAFCAWMIGEAKKEGKFVFVDPKSPDWKKYEGATCITPNLKEFKETLFKEGIIFDKNMEKYAKYLVEKYRLGFLVVTLGKDGIFFYHPEEGSGILPAQAKEVYDVSGAGDTVISAMSSFYAIGLPLKEILELANVSAGIVVGKVGTKPVYFKEIKEFYQKFS
jgi:D-beta-D-heptose 7-phosphate kinase/D-beta-D-heptose 1-phosphate adenosyltransferase